jgi:hypothetical protein
MSRRSRSRSLTRAFQPLRPSRTNNRSSTPSRAALARGLPPPAPPSANESRIAPMAQVGRRGGLTRRFNAFSRAAGTVGAPVAARPIHGPNGLGRPAPPHPARDPQAALKALALALLATAGAPGACGAARRGCRVARAGGRCRGRALRPWPRQRRRAVGAAGPQRRPPPHPPGVGGGPAGAPRREAGGGRGARPMQRPRARGKAPPTSLPHPRPPPPRPAPPSQPPRRSRSTPRRACPC